MRSTHRARHAGASNGAPKMTVDLSTFPIAEFDDRGAMPRTRVAGIGRREERRIYVAGSCDAEQSTDRRGDPSIFGATNGPHVGLHSRTISSVRSR